MEYDGVAKTLNPVTAKDLRQELDRFANEILKPQIAVLGAQIQRSLDVKSSKRLDSTAVSSKKKHKRDSVDLHIFGNMISGTGPSVGGSMNAGRIVSSNHANIENMDTGPEPEESLKVRKFPKRGATSSTHASGQGEDTVPLMFDNSDFRGSADEHTVGGKRKDISLRFNLRKSFWQGAIEDIQGTRKKKALTVQFRDEAQRYSGMSILSGRSHLSARGVLTESESPDEQLAPSSILEHIIDSDVFNFLVVALILCNIIFIAVETDYMARNWTRAGPWWFDIFEGFFCICFVLEMALRLACSGCKYFCDLGNIFDAIMVASQVIETCISIWYEEQSLHTTIQFRLLRLVRLLRMFRVTRIFRVVHHLRELRLLVISTLESLRPLLWVLLPLFMIFGTFAIMLTQMATDHKLSIDAGDVDEDLEKYYGTVDRVMLVLYQIISDGIHWGEILEPLEFATPWVQIFFVLYVFITVLCMMNVIMGIFVDSVARAAEQSKKRSLVNQMQVLFHEIDADGSGTVEWEEFEAQLKNPQMLAYLRDIDLDYDSAIDLFQLLDVDDCGSIGVQDWLSGCLLFTGPAKALDLAMVLHEVRNLSKTCSDNAEEVQHILRLHDYL